SVPTPPSGSGPWRGGPRSSRTWWRACGRRGGTRPGWRATGSPGGGRTPPTPREAGRTPPPNTPARSGSWGGGHVGAGQDNLTNPAKAAADGVWRDLRPVLGEAVDFGGLTARSHQRFLDVYMRHHNRLANGAALEVMEKILAVVEHGLVDVSVGPDARVE